MRSVGIGLLVLFVGVAGWFVSGRLALTAGPPEAVVREFLRAASAGDWGRAESYMTSHARYRIGQEGLNGIEQFATTRLLHPFTQFSIVRVESDGDKATVLVRLASPPGNPGVGAHIVAGRMEGGMFVHAHRFILQREGRAWRIYEFEDAGVQP